MAIQTKRCKRHIHSKTIYNKNKPRHKNRLGTVSEKYFTGGLNRFYMATILAFTSDLFQYTYFHRIYFIHRSHIFYVLDDDAKMQKRLHAQVTKTAFQTHKRLFRLKVMAFGLFSVPATFSRLIRKLLSAMKNLDNFLDDILIFTQTWEVHLLVLHE